MTLQFDKLHQKWIHLQTPNTSRVALSTEFCEEEDKEEFHDKSSYKIGNLNSDVKLLKTYL